VDFPKDFIKKLFMNLKCGSGTGQIVLKQT
jgi:hypothetical protein